MIFGLGTEQRLAAADALVGPGGFRILVLSRERRFGPLLSGYIILIQRELLFPSLLILLDLVCHNRP